MLEAIRAELVQCLLTCMAKGGMPQIMGQTDRLGQILVEPQGPGNGAGDLRNLQCMSQPGPVQIAFRREKHLRFLLEAAEGLAVQHPVTVSLEHRPDRVLFLLHHPSPALVAESRPRCKGQMFDLFRALSYIHTGSPPFFSIPPLCFGTADPNCCARGNCSTPGLSKGEIPCRFTKFCPFFQKSSYGRSFYQKGA